MCVTVNHFSSADYDYSCGDKDTRSRIKTHENISIRTRLRKVSKAKITDGPILISKTRSSLFHDFIFDIPIRSMTYVYILFSNLSPEESLNKRKYISPTKHKIRLRNPSCR